MHGGGVVGLCKRTLCFVLSSICGRSVCVYLSISRPLCGLPVLRAEFAEALGIVACGCAAFRGACFPLCYLAMGGYTLMVMVVMIAVIHKNGTPRRKRSFVRSFLSAIYLGYCYCLG